MVIEVVTNKHTAAFSAAPISDIPKKSAYKTIEEARLLHAQNDPPGRQFSTGGI